MPNTKFLRISCPRCKSTQITYGNASTKVKCKSCNKLLLKNQGGRAKIQAPIKEIL